jgi:hypothetical protein
MRGRGKGRVLLALAVVGVALCTQGCRLFTANPTPPPTPLIPTIVGVVEKQEITATNLVYTLADGRSVTDAFNDKDLERRSAYQPGELLLARESAPRFIDFLQPMVGPTPGCWNPWGGEGNIVWDEGASLLFTERLELPKSPTFHNNATTEVMDGRTVWKLEHNLGGSVCVNSVGQVEWVLNPNLPTG